MPACLLASTPGSKQESKVKIRDERGADGTFNVTVNGLTSLNATNFEDVMTCVTRMISCQWGAVLMACLFLASYGVARWTV